MNNLTLVWTQFAICAVLIGVAGFQLSRYGDIIAQRTGLTGSWVGLALLATVTSLPELVTGITSVTIVDAPNLAVGNALGSCVLNLVFLVVIDFVFRKEPVWHRAGQGHVLAAAFGLVMLGFVLLSLLVSHLSAAGVNGVVLPFAQMGFGTATPIILMLYLLAMRTVFSYENAKGASPTAVDALGQELPGLRLAMVRFGLAGLVVALAGLWLPFASVELAEGMGWSRSFVGTMFVSLATTLPELAVTLSALRVGALDMAIGNLLGSNLFNVAIIAVDDLFYRKGSLLVDVSLVHAITASSALIMTGLAVVGLFLRPQSRVLRAVGWVSVGLAVVYVFNTYFLYLHGV